MTATQDVCQCLRPRRRSERFGRNRRLLELIERHTQPAGAGIASEMAEQLQFTQSRAEPGPVCFGRKRRDHCGRPTLAVSRQLRAPLERCAREIPGGGIHQARETLQGGVGTAPRSELLHLDPQLPRERMHGIARGAPGALAAPPLEAGVGDVMIEAGPHAGADFALDRAE